MNMKFFKLSYYNTNLFESTDEDIVNTNPKSYSSTVSKRNLNSQNLLKMKLISNNLIQRLQT